MIKVTIVDDNAAVRSKLIQILTETSEFELLGSYDNAEEANILVPMIKPDLVIMDINLSSGESGIECIRKLKSRHPEILFIVYTVFEDEDKIFDALCAGASGYLLKRTIPQELLRALREVYEGGAPMSALIAHKVVRVFQVNEEGVGWNPMHAIKGRTLPGLSKRENEILQQLSSGLLYKEIASKLFISPETVRKHVYHIYGKLQVNNRIEAINKYFRRS
jgi:DNA-binding NarL/FixJ family response regulator